MSISNRDGNLGSVFRSPVGFRSGGFRCGCNFAYMGPPTLDPNRTGCGREFYFLPVVHLKPEKNSHNFGPAA
jgi:hypothetical protein